MNVSNKSYPLPLDACNGLASVKPFSLPSLQIKFRGVDKKFCLIPCYPSPRGMQTPCRPSPVLLSQIPVPHLEFFWGHLQHMSEPGEPSLLYKALILLLNSAALRKCFAERACPRGIIPLPHLLSKESIMFVKLFYWTAFAAL